jgi:nicotinamide-nucleotide amidase
MRAEILTIGDELCRGEIIDTNSSWLAGKLWDLDITTRWMTSCLDDERDIAAAVTQAASRADVVLCSGGLGPTEDDLTVDVLAALTGTQPIIEEAHRAKMEAWLARRVVDPAAPPSGIMQIQLRQVRVPNGARVHPNPGGLAPGFEVAVQGVPVICMPGVPRELYSIWDAGLEARLRELRGETAEKIARRIYRVFGRGESQISQVCRGIVDGIAGASIHYQVKFPETLVKIVVRDRDGAAAAERLAAIDAEIRKRLPGHLYGDGDENLVGRVVRRLIETKQTLATAESCTGGMIGELVTSISGSSKAFLGGAITYANSEKIRQLGVDQTTLDSFGAVSEQTVFEMALGARERFGSTFAVAVSGVAGPDGGTPEKPVGLVWLAVARAGGVTTKKITWPGTRDQVRTLASWWALRMVDEAIA